jgi:hypothetical protein
MMESHVARRTDVHRRAQADGREAFEHRDVFAGVAAGWRGRGRRGGRGGNGFRHAVGLRSGREKRCLKHSQTPVNTGDFAISPVFKVYHGRGLVGWLSSARGRALRRYLRRRISGESLGVIGARIARSGVPAEAVRRRVPEAQASASWSRASSTRSHPHACLQKRRATRPCRLGCGPSVGRPCSRKPSGTPAYSR